VNDTCVKKIYYTPEVRCAKECCFGVPLLFLFFSPIPLNTTAVHWDHGSRVHVDQYPESSRGLASLRDSRGTGRVGKRGISGVRPVSR
jgi:hypothetical protein